MMDRWANRNHTLACPSHKAHSPSGSALCVCTINEVQVLLLPTKRFGELPFQNGNERCFGGHIVWIHNDAQFKKVITL